MDDPFKESVHVAEDTSPLEWGFVRSRKSCSDGWASGPNDEGINFSIVLGQGETAILAALVTVIIRRLLLYEARLAIRHA